MNISLHASGRSRVPAVSRTLGATVLAWLNRIGSAIWRALEAAGRARARQALRQAADRYEVSQPELARQLRAASRYDVGR
jgi:hypothetical protein